MRKPNEGASYDAAQAEVCEKGAMKRGGEGDGVPNYKRLALMLYRSLDRLSVAIESCARIGFEESKPTSNATHAQVWLDLNDAQKDAKLKLQHYAAPAMKRDQRLEARITDYLSKGGLFNPEAMEHDKVRELLIDCRRALWP